MKKIIEITRRNITPENFLKLVEKELIKKFGEDACYLFPTDFEYWKENNFDVTVSNGAKRTDEYFFLTGIEMQFYTDKKGLGYFFLEEITN